MLKAAKSIYVITAAASQNYIFMKNLTAEQKLKRIY
jgi:hypothetical protein